MEGEHSRADTLRVGYLQFRPRFGKVKANCRRVLERLAAVEADLIVLPELAFTGYLFRDRAELESLAEDPRDSAVVSRLVELCRARGLHVVTGFAERDGSRCFNSALLLGPQGLRDVYRKIHLFNNEKDWFDPGDRPPRVHDVAGARVGMLICFDWVFPEVTRRLALDGVDVLCHPSNLVLDYCQKVMLARCIENRIFAVTTNRFGADRRPHGSVRFTGRSQVVDPTGQRLLAAPSQREVLQLCEIDPRRARDKMITARNHVLEDRRPEFY